MGKSSSKSGKPKFEKEIVFKSKEGEVFKFPAIYYNDNDKTLFAFAEKRTSQEDSDVVALVMRKGKVNRKSEVKWSKPEEVVRKCSCGSRPINPCVVYEKHTQTLFLFFIYVNETRLWQIEHHENKARLCYITKKKKDKKWCKFIEVTDLRRAFKNWSTFAIGPGHGIQTKSGRMIVPAYAFTKDKEPTPHAFCFYSDDCGKTWECEEMLPETSMECEMTEIVDTTKGDSLIYCNARSLGGQRVQAAIDQTGFHTLTNVTPLKELQNGCQGSVISFPSLSADEKPTQEVWVLFSHPTTQTSDWERFDLGVYLSIYLVRSVGHFNLAWSQPWVINKGPSGYSDLTYIEDGWFACLMECGEKSATDDIAYQVFSYDEALKGIAGFQT
ncbi:sialidase-4-like [Poeciliopsis prolifica]|uniref:sialidase-4-like n=1 Tax=Poeciliopsis prolifica TaxID=188132 RepID=UPI002413D701|nr:sialidase-4-like [Poeciliopsis prolifica]